MKTRLISIALILVIFSLPAFSRKRPKADTGVHFGIEAGFSMQNLYGTDYWGDKLGNDFIPGYRAGVNANIPLFADLYLQPGLILSANGAKSEEVGKSTTLRLYYGQIPLNILFRPQVGDGHLLIGAGPYLSCGFYGNEKYTGTQTGELKVKFVNQVTQTDPSTSAYYKPLDAGGTVILGYELYSGLFFQINGQLGLLKINPEYESLTGNKTSLKNLGFGVSAGFRF